jgi:three-Cys-motif partner protein
VTPSTTLWRLEPHTRGKHLVLRNYLDAWLPILGRYNGRILFIDGFAGPGKYQYGEEGSPLIALNAFCEHRAKDKISAEVVFIFIEKDESRANHLESLINPLRSGLPPNCSVEVINDKFDGTMNVIMDLLDDQEKNLAPSFIMVDPFGVSETPMEVIARILRNRKSEVFISFMYDYINRFRSNPEFEPHLNELFGCTEWKTGIEIEDSIERKQFYYNLYERKIRESGATFVVHFDLFEGNRLIYSIFFGTKHILGSDRMKQAIWKVTPFGDFAFRGVHANQLTLGLEEPDLDPLKELILNQFIGKGWIGIEEIQEFVSSDATDYHSGHYKKVIRELEQVGQIEVNENTRKRRLSYPAGTKLKIS